MANPVVLDTLSQGVEIWNRWREETPPDLTAIAPDFRGADLRGVNLAHANLALADFRGCSLDGASFSEAFLLSAKFSDLVLRDVSFANADLSGASFKNSQIIGGSLGGADLARADLTGAILDSVHMMAAQMIHTKVSGASFRSCRVWAISAWGLDGEPLEQRDLIITPLNQGDITTDNLELAQFLYLLLSSQGVRRFFQTITTRSVLILGRFVPERKMVLDAVRDKLRALDYLPIIFDFDAVPTRNLTETALAIANLSMFVIADLTDPRSIQQELAAIVYGVRSVPVVPIIQVDEEPWSLFRDYEDMPSVLDVVRYVNQSELIGKLEDSIVRPARLAAENISRRRSVTVDTGEGSSMVSSTSPVDPEWAIEAIEHNMSIIEGRLLSIRDSLRAFISRISRTPKHIHDADRSSHRWRAEVLHFVAIDMDTFPTAAAENLRFTAVTWRNILNNAENVSSLPRLPSSIPVARITLLVAKMVVSKASAQQTIDSYNVVLPKLRQLIGHDDVLDLTMHRVTQLIEEMIRTLEEIKSGAQQSSLLLGETIGKHLRQTD